MDKQESYRYQYVETRLSMAMLDERLAIQVQTIAQEIKAVRVQNDSTMSLNVYTQTIYILSGDDMPSMGVDDIKLS